MVGVLCWKTLFFCENTVFPAKALVFIGFCRCRKYFIHLIDSNAYQESFSQLLSSTAAIHRS